VIRVVLWLTELRSCVVGRLVGGGRGLRGEGLTGWAEKKMSLLEKMAPQMMAASF